MKNKRPIETFTMSFLDVVSCGFGAIILLLVLLLRLEPVTSKYVLSELTEKLESINEEVKGLEVTKTTLQKDLDNGLSEASFNFTLREKRKEIERLQKELKETINKRASGPALDSQIDETKREIERLQSKLDKLKNKAASIREIHAPTSETDETRKMIEALQKDLKEIKDREASITGKLFSRKELQEAQTKFNRLNKEISELKIKRISIQAKSGKSVDLQDANKEIEKLINELEKAKKKGASIQKKNQDISKTKNELNDVMQSLTEEMKILSKNSNYSPPEKDAVIGGIPVDSEYIIFIIDTSGSMLQAAWPMVITKVGEVLSTYPNVKGIQVINDMGHYMFKSYAGVWIPDTPALRTKIMDKLAKWKSYSNSSPVEGINHALRTFFKEGRKISLYIFGDDFSTGGINDVVKKVRVLNRKDSSGKTRVRIHTFGFPVLFGNQLFGVANDNRIGFAHLMRLLAEENSGSFVGLTP